MTTDASGKKLNEAESKLDSSKIEEAKGSITTGDGRNDSPGHCSQYCSYTLMEDTTKKILTIKTLDKRMTDRKSVNMEKLGFERGMRELESEQVEVKEVVTDAHLGIGALMKSRYPDKKHTHDIWHVAKNLGKNSKDDCYAIAQKKQNSVLLKWSKDIINHFWFACKEANTCSQFVVRIFHKC
ncbi:uncharacterized protein LOC132738455 [Ruditapes philippinarum]|uniref:uncharacterized protein LOC132738455 n=1 Tax=Ruditapes philippinarum TaxID=129788 RepID=UPI00295A6158|nr:uncharacterized protein LOC132738455 [Ruditapes philippinarum]